MRKILGLTIPGILAAGLAVGAPPTVPELLPRVPAQARAVVAVDAATLRSHPAVQSWLLDHASWGDTDAEAADFLAEAGLDPLRDVTAMVVAMSPGGAHGAAVALFAGRFDPAALAAALTRRGASPITLGGVPGFRLPEKNGGDTSAVLAQPSPELLIVGGEAAVLASLSDTMEGSPLVAAAVKDGQIDPRAPFWAVATLPAGARQKAADAAARIQGNSDQPIREVVIASGAVQSVAVQAFLDDSLRLSGVAVADTEENADLLRDAAKGALAAARLHSQDRAPELVSVLRDVQVRSIGKEVTVASVVPVALLEKLLAAHAAENSCGPSSHS